MSMQPFGPFTMFVADKAGRVSQITIPEDQLTPEMNVLRYFLFRARPTEQGGLTKEDGWAIGRLRDLVVEKFGEPGEPESFEGAEAHLELRNIELLPDVSGGTD